MTREEAVAVLEWLVDDCFPGDNITIHEGDIEAMRVVIAALRGPVPDPETGLVLCGCGGKAVYDYYYESDDLDCGKTHSVSCKNPDCWIEVKANTKNDSIMKWNLAMGYGETK